MIRRDLYTTQQEIADRLVVSVSALKGLRKRPINPLPIPPIKRGGRFRVTETVIAAWEARAPGGAPALAGDLSEEVTAARWRAHYENFVALYLPAAKLRLEIQLKRPPLNHEIIGLAWKIAEAHHPGIAERSKRPLTAAELERHMAAASDDEVE